MNRISFAPAFAVALLAAASARADDAGWIQLSAGEKPLEGWENPASEWIIGGDAALDEKNPKMLAAKPGVGVLLNGPKGNCRNLISKKKFADVDAHVEFLIGKRSNAGVKLMGLYEIQIFDSFGVKEPTGADCGGIYPRAEEKPKYHHIDNGIPPKVNAAKPAGEWQTLDITFTAPRFENAKKTANGKFVKVVLNGQVVHENVEVEHPTGHYWRLSPEVAEAPLLLQADHGPVAYRNVRIRSLAK